MLEFKQKYKKNKFPQVTFSSKRYLKKKHRQLTRIKHSENSFQDPFFKMDRGLQSKLMPALPQQGLPRLLQNSVSSKVIHRSSKFQQAGLPKIRRNPTPTFRIIERATRSVEEEAEHEALA